MTMQEYLAQTPEIIGAALRVARCPLDFDQLEDSPQDLGRVAGMSTYRARKLSDEILRWAREIRGRKV
jgi:hypothetical protein